MTDTLSSPVRLPPASRAGKPAAIALGLLALVTGTLQSVVGPALPLLQRELGISPTGGALVTTTLLIAGAAIAPIAGKLGDRFGGKRVLLRLMAVVSAGGLISSMAPNLIVLLLGQLLQGAMVGALPLSYILVRKNFSSGGSQVGIGVITGAFVGGGMVGTLIAGPVAAGLSWNWMFAIPTILIMGMTAALHRLMPDDPPAHSETAIDWPGMALLSGTLVTLMLTISLVSNGAPALLIGAVAVVSALLATSWVVVERRVASPIVDLRMLAASGTWGRLTVTFAICVGSAMALFLVPQLLGLSANGYGFGASTTAIGLYMLPGMIAGTVAGPIGGIAARRFGTRPVLITSIVVEAAALLLLTSMHSLVTQLVFAKVVIGLAAGVGYTALVTSAATAVDQKDTGIATSLVLVTKVVGSALGLQLGGAILTAGTNPISGVPVESAFVTSFVIAGVVTALSLFVVRTVKKGVPA